MMDSAGAMQPVSARRRVAWGVTALVVVSVLTMGSAAAVGRTRPSRRAKPAAHTPKISKSLKAGSAVGKSAQAFVPAPIGKGPAFPAKLAWPVPKQLGNQKSVYFAGCSWMTASGDATVCLTGFMDMGYWEFKLEVQGIGTPKHLTFHIFGTGAGEKLPSKLSPPKGYEEACEKYNTACVIRANGYFKARKWLSANRVLRALELKPKRLKWLKDKHTVQFAALGKSWRTKLFPASEHGAPSDWGKARRHHCCSWRVKRALAGPNHSALVWFAYGCNAAIGDCFLGEEGCERQPKGKTCVTQTEWTSETHPQDETQFRVVKPVAGRATTKKRPAKSRAKRPRGKRPRGKLPSGVGRPGAATSKRPGNAASKSVRPTAKGRTRPSPKRPGTRRRP
ncbi:MAG: hypothetical protein KC502_17925 [Myxococcales bacterium]|nr:hypothetical protein [Myxococcales bacterium]